MTKKIITGITAAVLLITMAALAAQKVKDKSADKPKIDENAAKAERPVPLLDQLNDAYKANDKQKMGEIINKMMERREKMKEMAKFNKWHKWAHRKMARQMAPGWGQGPNQGSPMPGPHMQQFQNRCCPGCGMPKQNRMPGQGWQKQGWDGEGRQNFGPRQGAFNMQPDQLDMPGREKMNIPPADLGW